MTVTGDMCIKLITSLDMASWPKDRCMQAGRRWCLSGTPIQNSVEDLYSCFCFLGYSPYCKRAAFKSMLRDPLQEDPPKGAPLLKVCLKVHHLPPCHFVCAPSSCKMTQDQTDRMMLCKTWGLLCIFTHAFRHASGLRCSCCAFTILQLPE